MSDKFQELGIPEHEVTPSVSVAVSGLLDHVESLNRSLQVTKTQLENIQAMVDVDFGNLPNRKALLKRLEWSIAMNKRYSGATCVVNFAIHDFENISGVYGYQSGGRVANYTAEYITNNIRDTDYLARIGENQFAAIMYFATFIDVKAKAERLCADLRQKPFRLNNGLINVVLNYGAHLITAADDAESALLAATNAMFITTSQLKFESINFKA